MLEALFVTGLAGLLTIIAVPQITSGVDHSRGLAAVRFLASRMALARSQAIARSANVALRFEAEAEGVWFSAFADGDGDGVRADDLATGVDSRLDPPVLLSDLFPGARIGLGEDDDGVHVGASGLLSFTPMGTATSGSVYVQGRDGTQWAIRVLGTTARTRILRSVPGSAQWVQAF